jgi:hypothetical protein
MLKVNQYFVENECYSLNAFIPAHVVVKNHHHLLFAYLIAQQQEVKSIFDFDFIPQ